MPILISLEGNICCDKLYYLKLLESTGYNVRYNDYVLNTGDKSLELQFFDGSPYTNNCIYSNLIMDDTPTWKPDIIIYLFCCPSICLQEHYKGQMCNANYLQGLHLKYEILCDDINWKDNMYKVNIHDDRNQVFDNIKDIIGNIKQSLAQSSDDVS